MKHYWSPKIENHPVKRKYEKPNRTKTILFILFVILIMFIVPIVHILVNLL